VTLWVSYWQEQGTTVLKNAVKACAEAINSHKGKLIVKEAPRVVSSSFQPSCFFSLLFAYFFCRLLCKLQCLVFDEVLWIFLFSTSFVSEVDFDEEFLLTLSQTFIVLGEGFKLAPISSFFSFIH